MMGTPGVWGLAAVPAIVLLVLVTGGSVLGVWAVEAYAAPRLAEWIEWTWVVGLLRFLLWLTAIAVAAVIGLALAQPLSGPALEALARRQGTALGAEPLPDDPLLRGMARSLRVTLFGLAITLPLLLAITVVELIVPAVVVVTVPLKLVLTALMLAWDVFDYPLSLRAAGVRARLDWFSTNFSAAMGFGLSLAAISLIPLAGLLFLPAGVAGATRVVVACDRRLGDGSRRAA